MRLFADALSLHVCSHLHPLQFWHEHGWPLTSQSCGGVKHLHGPGASLNKLYHHPATIMCENVAACTSDCGQRNTGRTFISTTELTSHELRSPLNLHLTGNMEPRHEVREPLFRIHNDNAGTCAVGMGDATYA